MLLFSDPVCPDAAISGRIPHRFRHRVAYWLPWSRSAPERKKNRVEDRDTAHEGGRSAWRHIDCKNRSRRHLAQSASQLLVLATHGTRRTTPKSPPRASSVVQSTQSFAFKTLHHEHCIQNRRLHSDQLFGRQRTPRRPRIAFLLNTSKTSRMSRDAKPTLRFGQATNNMIPLTMPRKTSTRMLPSTLYVRQGLYAAVPQDSPRQLPRADVGPLSAGLQPPQQLPLLSLHGA